MKRVGIFSMVIALTAGMLLTVSCNSCQSGKKSVVAEVYQPQSPAFIADSAYRYVEAQVAFGPRV
ncbi:MAG: glutamine cyclotransferase, partial [Proteiniphilum sp.]